MKSEHDLAATTPYDTKLCKEIIDRCTKGTHGVTPDVVLHVAQRTNTHPERVLDILENTGKLPDEGVTISEKTETILEEAQRLVKGDRQQDYDHPRVGCGRIASIWTALLSNKLQPGQEVTARDVCRLMVGLKLARDVAREKRDNLVDVAGYAFVAERLEE